MAEKKKKIKEKVARPRKKKVAAPAPAVAAKKRPGLPSGPKYYGTGRRKEAVAKVWLAAGSGKLSVNGKSLLEYFCGRRLLEYQVGRPFAVTKTAGQYDVFARVQGGGVPGQAVAVSLGIARALVQLSPDFKVLLKREGLMTRDPRMKERKKYGLKRARRAFQYTKR